MIKVRVRWCVLVVFGELKSKNLRKDLARPVMGTIFLVLGFPIMRGNAVAHGAELEDLYKCGDLQILSSQCLGKRIFLML